MTGRLGQCQILYTGASCNFVIKVVMEVVYRQLEKIYRAGGSGCGWWYRVSDQDASENMQGKWLACPVWTIRSIFEKAL